ncbi:4-hydroxy-tetrahydrodipicolinate synthase [Abyssalbus ytuae]|uniref:4-hydroxy-tetrahydrodipicolinate synthase n=1 Tax=Abyssalbus ytuae TaxID=2926907 RepID=A0A9E7CT87_9FLAO|nr:4-hydroxy-tetrahydrodipicolinate synthase [Abyssalbus ytuae]UOB17681.1 4-hydroxy-tetrahydrodipicolinate synthase [Abyssalbus ytuae]
MTKFIGTGVALVTPFKDDLSIDLNALEKLVNYVIEGGVEYIVVLGTTAETATLTKSEKEIVKQTIIKINKNRVPLVIGIGGNNTAEIVSELKSTNLDGFDAILSVSPYYNKPSQEGIYQHYKAIAAATTKPVIIYNVPGRTASNILPQTILRLAKDVDNIIGVKEAAGDMVQAMRILKDKPKDFLVISGDDMLTLPITLAGGSGVISVIGQGFPKEFSGMVRAALTGNIDEAANSHYQLMNMIDFIFEEGNPVGIKAVLEQYGMCRSNVRLPLINASNGLKQKINSFISVLQET